MNPYMAFQALQQNAKDVSSMARSRETTNTVPSWTSSAASSHSPFASAAAASRFSLSLSLSAAMSSSKLSDFLRPMTILAFCTGRRPPSPPMVSIHVYTPAAVLTGSNCSVLRSLQQVAVIVVAEVINECELYLQVQLQVHFKCWRNFCATFCAAVPCTPTQVYPFPTTIACR